MADASTAINNDRAINRIMRELPSLIVYLQCELPSGRDYEYFRRLGIISTSTWNVLADETSNRGKKECSLMKEGGREGERERGREREREGERGRGREKKRNDNDSKIATKLVTPSHCQFDTSKIYTHFLANEHQLKYSKQQSIHVHVGKQLVYYNKLLLYEMYIHVHVCMKHDQQILEGHYKIEESLQR